ncbi:Putative cyclic di-GMP phosphodiesterase YliE [Paraliobacillus sp. PM-2]|uniref:EAL domain-containing protein n=1 Tax=Paraliobacillus sp. PM-2 TaxID=1462524 RepID=UPI00061CB301|nr:EAL domain-containing protein [Paraliobacillus sp. PM-2]CQR46214.1 Putative cyclic di-GMP phosphodiesterase YliE [Paraliobacillus sp. PM-2]
MLIDTVIEEEHFYHYFQPIFNINGQKVIGYEVLLRTSLFPNPVYTFQAAKEVKRLYELDSKSIKKAITTYYSSAIATEKLFLFINVFPSSIVNEAFDHFLEHLLRDNQIRKDQLVLEISESELIEDPPLFRMHIERLKQQGFHFALDDVGKGYANFDMMIDLEPNYIKLDRLFSYQLDQSKKKQNLIRFFLQYCKENDIKLILEGLETEEELQVAKAVGITYVQGFLLGKPAPIDNWE